jgi:hypothetical protein
MPTSPNVPVSNVPVSNVPVSQVVALDPHVTLCLALPWVLPPASYPLRLTP